MDARDVLTQQYFNGKVTIDAGGQDFVVNGRVLTDADIAGLTGAPDGSDIQIKLADAGISMVALNADVFEFPAEYSLVGSAETNGTLLLDETIMLKHGLTAGIGLRLFATQARTAQQLGIEAILLDAAGSHDSEIFNGY